jgi:hypothetical protein
LNLQCSASSIRGVKPRRVSTPNLHRKLGRLPGSDFPTNEAPDPGTGFAAPHCGANLGFLTRAVKSRFLWLLLSLPLLGGCETTYTELRVTNPRGELIADWIARGFIWHIEEGWRITAVQRTDGPPYPKTTRYPDGWRTVVVGPYVHHTRCAKPAWLDDCQAK